MNHKLLSTKQIYDDLKENFSSFKTIEKQIITHERDVYKVREVVNGIPIMTFFIHHRGGERTKSVKIGGS